MEQVFDAARLCTEPDSYIAVDAESEAIRELLANGYRWVRTDCGFAVFEKPVSLVGGPKKEK
jgi:hypothetical protein